MGKYLNLPLSTVSLILFKTETIGRLLVSFCETKLGTRIKNVFNIFELFFKVNYPCAQLILVAFDQTDDIYCLFTNSSFFKRLFY